MRPHRWQPTRLPRPWDSPGKSTAVGCRFLLQCMKVKSESEVDQPCPTLCDLMDCSPPGSPVPGTLQARTLQWAAVSFSNAPKALQCPEAKRSEQPAQTQNLPSVFDHGALPKYPDLNLTNIHREPPVSQGLSWLRRTQPSVWQLWALLPPGRRLRANSCDAECLTGFVSSSHLLQELGFTVPS